MRITARALCLTALIVCAPLFGGRASGMEEDARRNGVDIVADAIVPELLDWTRPEIERVLPGPWTRFRTPHFRVFVERGLAVEHAELVELEASLAELADRLDLDPAIREGLRHEPIDYYHIRNRALLRRFTEVDAEGIAFAEFRIVISLRLPHAHEVAHLLLYERTQPAPPATAPLLLEGLASWLAGVGNAAPRVVAARGEQRLEHEDVDLRALLTTPTFHRSALDTHGRYQCSARFCAFLVDTWGLDAVLDLYRLLAGDTVEMLRRPVAAASLQLEGWSGLSWEELELRFERWREENPVGGLRLALEPTRPADGTLGAEGHVMRWWNEPDGSLVVSASTENVEVDAELLWGRPERIPLEPRSPQPRWRRWGLRLGPEGIHLTDHRRRRRLAVPDSDLRWGVFPLRRSLTVRVEADAVPEPVREDEASLFVTPVFRVDAP